MVDFAMTDPVRELQSYLLAKLPGLEHWLSEARVEHEEDPQSEYWLFSYVVRPYLESLHSTSSEGELAKAWAVLEQIAATGSPSAKNELRIMMEELDLWNFYAYMGPVLRENWLLTITWFPTAKSRTQAINTHVDQGRYQERWLEEIERIGGFDCLTADEQNRIGSLLLREFSIDLV